MISTTDLLNIQFLLSFLSSIFLSLNMQRYTISLTDVKKLYIYIWNRKLRKTLIFVSVRKLKPMALQGLWWNIVSSWREEYMRPVGHACIHIMHKAMDKVVLTARNFFFKNRYPREIRWSAAVGKIVKIKCWWQLAFFKNNKMFAKHPTVRNLPSRLHQPSQLAYDKPVGDKAG